MTKEAPRPYTPETREVPLTFKNCRHHAYRTTGAGEQWDMCYKIVGDCKWIRERGLCPRGVAV
jgi:hypothetical protein